MEIFEEYLAQATAAEVAAEKVALRADRLQLRAIARYWRELAREAAAQATDAHKFLRGA